MSRHCELKLTDIVNVEKGKKSKISKDSKVQPQNKLSKNEDNSIMKGERTTRSSKRVGDNNSENLTIRDKNSKRIETSETLAHLESSENDEKVTLFLKKPKTAKRKCSPEMNTDDLILSKRHNTKATPTISDHTDKVLNEILQEKVNKKRKRNTCNLFWESKLTGACRVSKRLTNLRIKNKILEKIEACIDNHSTLIKNKLSDKKRTEAQSNYGKLNHAKKIYTKIGSNRKSCSFRKARKPYTTNSWHISKSNKLNNVITECCDSKNGSVDKSTSTVKDINEPPNINTVTEDIGCTIDENQELTDKSDTDQEGNSVILEEIDQITVEVQSSDIIEIDLESVENTNESDKSKISTEVRECINKNSEKRHDTEAEVNTEDITHMSTLKEVTNESESTVNSISEEKSNTFQTVDETNKVSSTPIEKNNDINETQKVTIKDDSVETDIKG